MILKFLGFRQVVQVLASCWYACSSYGVNWLILSVILSSVLLPLIYWFISVVIFSFIFHVSCLKYPTFFEKAINNSVIRYWIQGTYCKLLSKLLLFCWFMIFLPLLIFSSTWLRLILHFKWSWWKDAYKQRENENNWLCSIWICFSFF